MTMIRTVQAFKTLQLAFAIVNDYSKYDYSKYVPTASTVAHQGPPVAPCATQFVFLRHCASERDDWGPSWRSSRVEVSDGKSLASLYTNAICRNHILIMIIVRPPPWLVGTTKAYPALEADIIPSSKSASRRSAPILPTPLRSSYEAQTENDFAIVFIRSKSLSLSSGSSMKPYFR